MAFLRKSEVALISGTKKRLKRYKGANPLALEAMDLL